MGTPLMAQYEGIKARHADAILFFRLGDFYETFNDDARTAARVLGITLTARTKEGERVPMAGVPHHAAAGYIQRLLRAGHKVAICEQVGQPRKGQELVEREVIRVVTPGTLLEDGMLDPKRENLLAAACGDGDRIGLAWADLSTGRFEAMECPAKEAAAELASMGAAELLLPEGWRPQPPGWLEEPGRMVRTWRPDWQFEHEASRKGLLDHFRVGGLAGYGCEGLREGVAAAGAILSYLQETQKSGLGHIRRIVRVERDLHVGVDPETRRGLEVLEALLPVLDRTRTGAGGRLLREWLARPLREREGIEERLSAVGELFEEHPLRERLQAALHKTWDLERIAARIAVNRATPKDLASLVQTCEVLPELVQALPGVRSEMLARLASRIDPMQDLRAELAAALVDEPPAGVTEGGIFRDGYNAELDELRSILRDGKGWLARFQAEEIGRSGIPSLKVGFNRVFGYYIEITNAHKEKAPADYIRKQTLVGAERYITPALKERESQVLGADERAKDLERSLFGQLRELCLPHLERIQGTARALAEVDALASLAEAALVHRYVRPALSDDPVLRLKGGRHPVLERALAGEPFVPNDAELTSDAPVRVITGPNMAGKSTYIRQLALAVWMAQAGSFVAADEAEVGLADRIFARIGSGDDLARGQSTFLVEMSQAARILHYATAKSFVILDEIGRGTSTYDGMSLAWAVAEHLARSIRCRALFATHYHELTELAGSVPGVRNLHVAVREHGDRVVFLHQVLPGSTDRSYGIHVAQLAGVPEEVLMNARGILVRLESQRAAPAARKALRAGASREAQPVLFEPPPDPVVQRLRDLTVESLTPLAALNLLAELKKMAGG